MPAITLPPYIADIPLGTRGLAVAITFFSILLGLLRANIASGPSLGAVFGASNDSTVAFPWLVVIPGNIVWTPWTLLTAALCEASLIEYIFSIVTVVLSGKYLERVWGQIEFLKFCAVTIVFSNLIAVFLNVAEHFVLQDSGTLLFGQSYHGLMGLQTAFLVAFTQIIPEHQVQVLGFLKMRVKQLPMIYVGFSNVMCVLGYQSPFALIQFGWLTAWFYLRFVKYNEGLDFRGDRSETFSFASWFPSFLQKYISQASTFVFDIAVKLKILVPWANQDVEGGQYVGGNRAEAERRRAQALKALDQRMATKPAPRQGSGGASAAMTASTSGSGTGTAAKEPIHAPPATNPADVVFDSTAEEARESKPAINEKQ